MVLRDILWQRKITLLWRKSFFSNFSPLRFSSKVTVNACGLLRWVDEILVVVDSATPSSLSSTFKVLEPLRQSSLNFELFTTNFFLVKKRVLSFRYQLRNEVFWLLMAHKQPTAYSLQLISQILDWLKLESSPVEPTLFCSIICFVVVKEPWIEAKNRNNLCLFWRSPDRVVSGPKDVIVTDSEVVPKP